MKVKNVFSEINRNKICTLDHFIWYTETFKNVFIKVGCFLEQIAFYLPLASIAIIPRERRTLRRQLLKNFQRTS